MSKNQFLFRGYTILAAIIASGFTLSAPAFTGTIFPFLGVCFQTAMVFVLIAMTIQISRQQAHKRRASTHKLK